MVITPPSLCHKAQTDNLLPVTENYPNWPLYADVLIHPTPQLTPQCPIWADAASIDIKDTVGRRLVVSFYDQPGFEFDLPHHSWTPLNHSCTGFARPTSCKFAQIRFCCIRTVAYSATVDSGKTWTNEPYHRFVSDNKVWYWSVETPWSWRWRSQLAEEYGGNSTRQMKKNVGAEQVNTIKQESPAVADKPVRRLRKVCTVYVRAMGLL